MTFVTATAGITGTVDSDLAELTVTVTKSVSIEATHVAATMRPKGRMHALTGGQARFSH